MTPDNGVLPGWFRGILDIGAGLVAAGAAITATGVFAGREYARAYYETLGIPFSALNLGTDDYISLTSRIMLFTAVGVIAATLGIVPGILVPTLGEDTAESQHRMIRTKVTEVLGKIPSAARQPLWRNPLIWVIAILFVVVALEAFGWAGWIEDSADWLYDKVGRELVIAALITALSAALISFVATWLFRHSSPGTPQRSGFAVAAAIGVALAIVGIVLVASTFVGHADARHHSTHSDHFVKATLLVKGAVGIDTEKPKPVTSGGTPPATCDEFVPSETPQAPTSLCEITNVIVILHNNGNYFVSKAENINAQERKIYPIDEDRVVRITFDSHK